MPSALRFRNIDASPNDPVQDWPFEGILTALERGSLPDWARITRAIDADPWGPVARQVQDALVMELPYGVAELFQEIVVTARARAGDSERNAVAQEIRDLHEQSGLSRAAFAERIGTSVSRLSTYLSGKVVPSAALMVRMRRIATSAAGRRPPTDL
jgi:DNA-binding transcriptional regulator YiaG